MHSADAKILQTLSSLESEFFSALQRDSDGVAAFHAAWTAFNTEVQDHLEFLSEATLNKVHSFANIANIVSTSMLEIAIGGDKIHAQLQEYISQCLREDFDNLTINDAPRTQSAYIPQASAWLLENIHNPYPTKEIIHQIHLESGSPVKDINAWFLDARRRIGWNQLRKDYFPKRRDLVKAATRFFKTSHSNSTTFFDRREISSATISEELLDSQYAVQFVQMDERARELYCNKNIASQLANDIQSTDTWKSHGAEARTTSTESLRGRLQKQSTYDERASYPSPEYSPDRFSPSPPPSQSSNVGRKRRRSLSSTSTGSHTDQLAKRSRFISVIDGDAAVSSLPSPAPSAHESASEESNGGGLLAQPSYSPKPMKRKRSWSDAEGRLPKRSNNELKPDYTHLASNHISFGTGDAPIYTDQSFSEILGFDCSFTGELPPPVSESTMDECFDVDTQYQFYDFSLGFPVDINFCDSESDADSPELSDVIALPGLLPSVATQGGPASTFDLLSAKVALDEAPSSASPSIVTATGDLPLAWSFDTSPPLFPNAGLGDTLSSGWSNDWPLVSSNILPPWPSITQTNVPCNTDQPCSDPASGKKLTYIDKCLKITQLQMILAQAEVLRSEINYS